MSLYQVVNPATGETVSVFPTATEATLAAALGRVHESYQSWSTTAKTERAKILHRVADLYRDRADALAAVITREMGKTTAEALGEIGFVVDIYRSEERR